MKILVAVIMLIVLLILAVLLVRFIIKKPVKPIRVVLSVVFGVILLLGIVISLIGVKNLSDSKLEKFSGEWECAESLLEDEDIYTQFLRMDIDSKGVFSMYDGEAGNPGIEGVMVRIGSDKLFMICTRFDEFNTPPGWEEMNRIDVIEYELNESDNSLLLRYKDDGETFTLKFYKYE